VRSPETFSFLFAVFVVLAVVFFFVGVGATTPEETTGVLQKSGFTDIHPGDAQYFGCSEGDKPGRSFVATNPQGQRVEGIVCCGVWKACTVRF
jgi:hypothetical protein